MMRIMTEPFSTIRPDAEQARATVVRLCDDPQCSGIHVMLADAFGEIFAQHVIPLDGVEAFVDDLREHAERLREKFEP